MEEYMEQLEELEEKLRIAVSLQECQRADQKLVDHCYQRPYLTNYNSLTVLI